MTIQNFGVSKMSYIFFERSLLCSPRLHLFDQKYSNISKYLYNLK